MYLTVITVTNGSQKIGKRKMLVVQKHLTKQRRYVGGYSLCFFIKKKLFEAHFLTINLRL